LIIDSIIESPRWDVLIMRSNQVEIRYSWWANDTTIQKSFFRDLFNSAGYSVKEVCEPNAKCDFEIIGVNKPKKDTLLDGINRRVKSNKIVGQDNSFAYPHSYHPRTTGAKNKIWVTLENVRPPAQKDFFVTLSYDQFDFDQSNYYLPAWYMMIGLFGAVHVEIEGKGSQNEIERAHFKKLLAARKLTNYSEKSFAFSIFGNPHPVRLKAIDSLDKISKVDVFGRVTGKRVESKFKIGEKYKFGICFENNFYPGYVTEKLLQAYISGTIPIYWGCLGNDTSINRECFINMSDFETTEEFLDCIRTIDEAKYRAIYEKPFLIQKPDIEKVKSKLISVL
jgi:hypothetical protein